MGMRILLRVISLILFAVAEFFLRSNRRGIYDGITGYAQYNKARDNYVKKHKKLMRKTNNGYQLFNENLFCEYFPDEFTFKFSNTQNEKQSATARPIDNSQSKTNMLVFLDSIFYNFNESMSYDVLYARIARNQMFFLVDKYPKQSKPSSVNTQVQKYEEPQERININTATEEDFAKLPGINIIKAKKIVQHRNLHGKFNSINEFLRFVDPKPHFEPLIKANIFLGRQLQKEDDNNDFGGDERVVDLE